MTVTIEIPALEREEHLEGLITGYIGHVAVILMNRPEKANAYNRSMVRAFPELWLKYDADSNVRAIVLGSTSAKYFSAGIDLSEVADDGQIGVDKTLARAVHMTTRQMHVWKPVVCAVEGVAVGGGLHFVTDADIVVASSAASFIDTHVERGFVGALENIGIALKAGLGTALYMTLVGSDIRLGAERAYNLGLVQELVEPGQALNRALALAERIAKNSPSAVAASQEAIWGLPEMGYENALRHSWVLLRRQWSHPDSVEGPRAFADHREPNWAVR